MKRINKVNEEILNDLYFNLLAKSKKLSEIEKSFGDPILFKKLIIGEDIEKLSKEEPSLASKFKNYYHNFRNRKSIIDFYSNILEIKSCLYCNAQFSAHVKNDKLGFELDHFYSKDSYPWLALNVFNLIPVCANCNKKKSKNKLPIFYPYKDDINQITRFDLDSMQLILFLLGLNNSDVITWNLDENYKDFKEKLINHNQIFNIEKLYNNNFKDIVIELLYRQVMYDDARICELKNFDFIDDDMFERMKIGNYTFDKDINLRPLTKLMKDISNRLNLI